MGKAKSTATMKDYSENEISKIWSELLQCKENCNGINIEQEKGIIPRCLLLEKENRNTNLEGCIIVGLNPGISNNKERRGYQVGMSDGTIDDLWKTKPEHKYYTLLRKFAKNAGLEGIILWTELVKCECVPQNKAIDIPLQTYRNCVGKYLKKELKAIDTNWIIIAVGRETHKALSYLYPKRTIIGIPHPTASRGHFSGLFIGERFKDNVNKIINDLKENRGNTIWLKDE